jgi:hypothetical protein
MRAYASEIDAFKLAFYTGVRCSGIEVSMSHMLSAVRDDLRLHTVRLNGIPEMRWSSEDRIIGLALSELVEELSYGAQETNPPALIGG